MPGWRALGDPRLEEQTRAFEHQQPSEVLPPLTLLLAFAQSTVELSPYRRALRIRPELGISELRYAQLINRAIDDPEAQELAPALIERLRAQREERRVRRMAKPVGRSVLG
jgi:hypothetical protein